MINIRKMIKEISAKSNILRLSVLTIILVIQIQASSQGTKEDAKNFIARIQEAYRKASYLGFRVSYQYANAGTPANAIDTMLGQVQMDKSRCRMILDGTETVVTGRYIIQVMQDERTIYLSGARSSYMMNPLQMLDSVFAHMEGVSTAVTTGERSASLTMVFPPGQAYTRVRMEIDPATGYFQRITYSLNASKVMPQDMIDGPGHSAPYQQAGQLDMVFEKYETGHFDDTVFDENNFFTRIAGHFEPVGRYRDYHIFLASSNL